MYGYYILIEDNLKPWLIEVNASPSVSTTTESDRKLKMGVLKDVFDIVVPPEWFDENSKHGTNLCKETTVGSFSVIINEGAQADNTDTGKKLPGGKLNRGGTLWR